MFEFARRIAFGVDVGNFLQLQRAFERRWDSRSRAR